MGQLVSQICFQCDEDVARVNKLHYRLVNYQTGASVDSYSLTVIGLIGKCC